MLARVLLLGLLALVGLSFPAWATGPANYPPGGSGSGVVANTCTPGDFFSAVDGSGNFTCATPAGSGDVTAVGDCASGDCFTASSNNSSLIFEGSTADTSETTLTVTDPTADRTVTLPNLTGTVAIERVYDVRAYGAKCDDSTDDTAAIQAAIDAAEATGQGGVVQFPVGICIHTALTMDEPGVILRGMGASTSNNGTRLSCNITTGTCITMQSSCTYCGVENLGIGARGTPTDLVLIDGTSASNDHVSNLILGTQGYCTGIKNVLRNDNVDLFGPIAGASCRGISVVDDAVYLNRITGNWSTDIEGMIVIEQTSTNITDTVVISDTEIAQSGGAGAGLKIIGASTTNPPRWVEVSNSLFEAKTTGASAGDYPIYIDNVKEFKCTNCYAHGGFYAVRIDGGPGPIRFVNSEIGDARRDALYHDADVPTELIGTTVSDGSQETTNTYSGIHLTTNSRQFTMIGGRASDDLFFSGSGQKYGILIDAGADEYRFDNVGCEGNDTACASGLSPAAAQAAFTDAVALADSDWSNYVTLRASSLAGNYSLTLPTTDGATNDLLYNTDGSGTLGWRTPNAGTDITADLEEETHASEHSAGGADAITVTNLASACTDAQVLGGNAGGTGVECQTDDDVPEAADYSNLTAGTGITNSPTGTINATLGTAITSSEITDGEIVNADISATAAIALSKLANMSTDRLLGRDTASSGAIEELTVGGGLEFTGTGIQRSALTGDVTASAGSNSTTIAANSVALTTDTTGNYAAGDAEAGKALYINATSCSAGVITASDGTPSCLTASSTPEFVSRVMTAGGTLGNYAVVMADGSDDDEVIEATTSTTQILGCSQDSDGTTSTNPVEVAVAGIARCKADSTVTAGSLVKLGATGEFSLATTADKTWGRAVTDDDGAGSAYILLFDGAEGTIDHALDLWTSIPDLTSNTLSIINANPTVSMTSAGTLNGMNFAPAFTTSGIGLLTGFNFQPTYSHSSLVSQLYGFNMVGTYTSTDASAAMVASIMRNNATYTSSTANAEPFSSLIAVDDKPVISNTTATTSTSTPTSYITIRHDPVISINDADGATGGLAAMTLTNDIGLTMSGTYTETSGTLAVTNRVGFQYNEVTNTSSATAITNNIGVDIAALGAAGATTNIGIRNADTTVYTPCTDDISSNTDYLAAPACTVVNLTAGGVRDLTAGTDQIADGLDGQIVTYFFSGSNSIAFNDADNLNLTGTITLSTGDTLTLVFSSTLGAWIEISTSNN